MLKKVLLVGACLLALCGCEHKIKDNSNQKGKYNKVVSYYGVSYHFDEQMRCHVTYEVYEGDDEHGYEHIEDLNWVVYLKGYYYDHTCYEHTFFVCATDTTYDYYLIAGQNY